MLRDIVGSIICGGTGMGIQVLLSRTRGVGLLNIKIILGEAAEGRRNQDCLTTLKMLTGFRKGCDGRRIFY